MAVRVSEKNAPPAAHAGEVAAACSRQIANEPGTTSRVTEGEVFFIVTLHARSRSCHRDTETQSRGAHAAESNAARAASARCSQYLCGYIQTRPERDDSTPPE